MDHPPPTNQTVVARLRGILYHDAFPAVGNVEGVDAFIGAVNSSVDRASQIVSEARWLLNWHLCALAQVRKRRSALRTVCGRAASLCQWTAV